MSGAKSVYEVELEDGTIAYVVPDDIDDKHVTQTLSSEAKGIAYRQLKEEMKVKRVFRKMCFKEFEETIKHGGMLDPGGKNPLSEKWFTESLEHSKGFQNKGVGPGTNEMVAEFKVDKEAYKRGIRDHSIPQKGAKSVNEARLKAGEKPFNVHNNERLQNVRGKLNIGLKGSENVKAFNDSVIAIKKTDPHAFKNTNAFTQWVSHNKLAIGMAAVGIALDAANITFAVLNDKGEWGPHTTRSVSGIVGSYAGAAAGAELGALIGSVFPGAGTAIGSLLGSLLGGIIGSIAAEEFAGIWVSVRHVAPGPGPPPLHINPPDFGPPSLHVNPADSGPPARHVNPPSKGSPKLHVQPMRKGAPPTMFSSSRKKR